MVTIVVCTLILLVCHYLPDLYHWLRKMRDPNYTYVEKVKKKFNKRFFKFSRKKKRIDYDYKIKPIATI